MTRGYAGCSPPTQAASSAARGSDMHQIEKAVLPRAARPLFRLRADFCRLHARAIRGDGCPNRFLTLLLLAGRRNVLRARLLQHPLRARDLFGSRAVHGEQNASVLDATLVALGFVFGESGAHEQRSNDVVTITVIHDVERTAAARRNAVL